MIISVFAGLNAMPENLPMISSGQMTALPLKFDHYGQGSPLVILHGLLGSRQNWRAVAVKLKNSFSVYVPDLRNHGTSPHHDSFGYDEMAEDIKCFLQEHVDVPATLIGHSMGGKLAMRLAAMFPDMIANLIVIDIAPKNYMPIEKPILAALLSLELEAYSRSETIFNDLATTIPDAALRYFLLKNIVRDKAGRYHWRIHLKAIHDSYQNICTDPAIQRATGVRTLFVRGERSNFIEDEDLTAIRSLFPQSRVETVANAGHWVHIDAPEATCAVIKQFVNPHISS